ncbi:GDSL-like Lipase/Acylhydrolase [Legionella clemsonensis]|uniref:GDSL-like Lipase/Acylhydrolase n=2 Tax=Legionella clemsonensis TaxID=1867846 RepID=A0A222NZZ0_9GAMM|nr:GDSL-like Lipase/Acylhydrolase [Legionella clemsonensis]
MKLGIDNMDITAYRNYAYGQAQLLGKIELLTHNEEKEWSFTVPDLSSQIDEYLKDVNINPNNSLFFVFIGTNDVLNYKPISKEENKAFISDLLHHLSQQINRLKEIGANRIILFKWRDLKHFPLSKQLADEYQNNYLNTLDEMIEQFNLGILNLYQNDRIVHLYDTYSFDYKVYSSLKKYQWRGQKLYLYEKENACYLHGGNYIDYIHNKYCSSPWTHWFFDRIHPTTYIDFLMSEDVYFFLVKANLV